MCGAALASSARNTRVLIAHALGQFQIHSLLLELGALC